MKNSLQWRHLQEEGKFMARPQHSPTPSSTQAPATPFESRTRTKPEEKHLCRRWTKKIPKKDPQVLLQAGRIKPISDRSPQHLVPLLEFNLNAVGGAPLPRSSPRYPAELSQFPESLLHEAICKLFRSHAAGGSVRRNSFINLA